MSAAMAMRVRALEERVVALEARLDEMDKPKAPVTRGPGRPRKSKLTFEPVVETEKSDG